MTDHIRSYYTTTENGEKRLVITNLDESGKRMGPPVKYNTANTLRYVWSQEAPRYREEYTPEPPRYERRPYPYFDPYLLGSWIPDYPGSSFGFHVFPQFFVIRPRR